jgi:hypothetical protein
MANESSHAPSLTSTETADRIFVFAAIAAYAVSFVLISLFVFIENDESQPLREVFQWGYLIPVAGYSLFSLWISFGLFLFFHKSLNKFFPQRRISKFIALPVSLIIGVPGGLILLDKVLRSITA